MNDEIQIFGDILYVVRFDNGKFYKGGFSSDSETDELKYSSKYAFSWQPAKDMYLMVYLENKKLSYDLIKVKTHYEIVE